MPHCSLCGYVVEWVRSCKSSAWRLFNNDPSIITPGEFYFADDRTPHYQGWHNLWSRDWTSDVVPPDPPLGEQAGYARWSRGQPPAGRVRAGLVGSAECCSDGEHWPPPPIDQWHMVQGFDFRCFLPPIAVPTPTIPDTLARPTWIEGAHILSVLVHDPGAVTGVIQDWLGDSTIVTVTVPDGGLFPGSAIAQTPDYDVLFISGTDNTSQMVYQALFTLGGPGAGGGLLKVSIWVQATLAIQKRLERAGITGNTRPLVIIGHSYGGVIATLLGDQMLRGNPERDIRVIGYGVPKCVQTFTWRNISRLPWVFLANDGDPVCDLPPGLIQLGPLTLLVPTAVKFAWALWKKPGNQRIVYSDGSVVESQGYTATFVDLLTIVKDYLAGRPIIEFEFHGIDEYYGRLSIGP